MWTRYPVFPSGEVFSMPWASLVRWPNVPLDDAWVQVIDRTHRALGERSLMCMFRCPGEWGEAVSCGRWSRKLFLPRTIWTMRDQYDHHGEAVRAEPASEAARGHMPPARFLCHRCADLVYESAERTSRPGSRRTVNVWDRFVKRCSGCVLRGRDVKR